MESDDVSVSDVLNIVWVNLNSVSYIVKYGKLDQSTFILLLWYVLIEMMIEDMLETITKAAYFSCRVL